MTARTQLDAIARAAHPLEPEPAGPEWNLDELEGLLDPAPPRPAAVLLGLVDRGSGLNLLLTRRNEALRLHAGQVSLPGGRVDPGDADARDAALREADEEIGLAREQARPLGYLDPMRTITGYRVVPLVAEVDPAFTARPDPAEVAAVFEVPLSFLLAPAHLRTLRMEFGGRPRRVLEYAPYDGAPGHRIWGATASILYNLRQRLEGLQ